MRTTRSFILRLLVDAAEPSALRGVLRSIETEDDWPFSDELELIAVLHQMIELATTRGDNEAFKHESVIKERNHED